MSLPHHIDSVQRALRDYRGAYVFRVVEELEHDPLAQVLSYLEYMVPEGVRRTLSAVSPQMRLYTEILTWIPEPKDEYVSATTESKWLHCRLRVTAEAPQYPHFADSFWWMDACRLPLGVEVRNARSDILQFLASGLAAKAEELDSLVFSLPTCARSDAPSCEGQCGSFLCSLPTFPNLRKLSITVLQNEEAVQAAAYVSTVLCKVALLPIPELCINYVAQLGDLSAITGMLHLRSLTIAFCGFTDVSALLSCPCLKNLFISINPLLRSLSGLAGASSLETIDARTCGLHSLEGLASIPRLSALDVSNNHELPTTRGLAGAPRLKTLSLYRCIALHSVEGLNACPVLEELDISDTTSLHDLSGLAGAPLLRVIKARVSGLQHLTGVGDCLMLVEISLDWCRHLEDISGLAGAPRLEKLSATDCSISNVNGLGSCPRLAELNLEYNTPLVDIRDLARCPSLKHLNISGTGVTNTDFFSASVVVQR